MNEKKRSNIIQPYNFHIKKGLKPELQTLIIFIDVN